MLLGVYRKTEASSWDLLPTSPKSPENGYLMDFMLLKLLQLPLEAQVGVSTGPPGTHSVQGVFPAKVSDGHDVRSHQSHTPGDTSQAVGPRECHMGKEGLGSTSLASDPLGARYSVDLILESLPALDYEWTASQYVTWKLLRNIQMSLYYTRISSILYGHWLHFL